MSSLGSVTANYLPVLWIASFGLIYWSSGSESSIPRTLVYHTAVLDVVEVEVSTRLINGETAWEKIAKAARIKGERIEGEGSWSRRGGGSAFVFSHQ